MDLKFFHIVILNLFIAFEKARDKIVTFFQKKNNQYKA